MSSLIIKSIILLSSLFYQKPILIDNSNISKHSEPNKRITFIMGADKDNENKYFSLAKDYYSTNKYARTDFVVENITNIENMLIFLNTHSNNKPWKQINLVLHANPWTGMGVSIQQDGRRATKENLTEALINEEITKLKKGIIDSNTEINISGCGLGKDKDFDELLSIMFTDFNSKIRPIINISEAFVTYESTDSSTIKYDSDVYFAFYKRGYKPGDIILTNQLKKSYPKADIAWRDALTRTAPRFTGDSYYYTFHIPIIWIMPYDSQEKLPKIGTKSSKKEWIDAQEDLNDAIKELGIPKDKFTWTIRKIQITNEVGEQTPAIKAIGFCTVLSILKGN